MTTLGPVVYLGPSQTTSQLATLAALPRRDISKLPQDTRGKLMRFAAWQSGELAQPRQLLDELARQAAMNVQNAEAIPLDLWPAISLPALSWCDRMTLLLAGFGLTFEIDAPGSTIRLVPVPQNLPSVTPPASQTANRPSKSAKASGQKVYTMKVENESAGNVVKTVATYLGKELKYDPAVVEKLKQHVSLNVKDVSVEQLLDLTLQPVGLTYRLGGATLEILEAP